jgi:hypothetical protein
LIRSIPGWPNTSARQGAWVAAGDGGFAWIVGRTQRSAVTVRYGGEDVEVQADSNGNWAFIRETGLDEPFDTPLVVSA